MRGINKRLVLPTLLLGVVLVSGAVLATSGDEPTLDQQPETFQLPSISNRQMPAPVAVSEMDKSTETSTTLSVPANLAATTTPIVETESPTTNAPLIVSQTPTSISEPPAEEVVKTIMATLVIQGPGISFKHPLEVAADSMVYELMQQASTKFDFSLKVSHHSSLGLFVEGIAGTLNDPKTNRYWMYYVNGQLAPRGVSTQVVKEGDIIKWSYE